MTMEQLLRCQQTDIYDCEADNLTDLKQVDISPYLPTPVRMEQYLEQVGNPYLFRVDKLIVKVSYSGEKDLSATLTRLLASS